MSALHDGHAIETFKSLPTIAVEMLKSIILVNGGAAVAMLAFLGQSPQGRVLAPHAWWPLGLFAAGVFAAALAFAGAYLTQLMLYGESAFGPQHKGLRHTVFLWPSVILALVSVICFCAGAMSSVYVLANHSAVEREAEHSTPAPKSPLPASGPNPSIERTSSSGLRPLPAAAHVKR